MPACISAAIAKALLDARKRDVQVQVILVKSQLTEKYSSADFLGNQAVSSLINAEHAILPNKAMVIDGEAVIRAALTLPRRRRRRTRRMC